MKVLLTLSQNVLAAVEMYGGPFLWAAAGSTQLLKLTYAVERDILLKSKCIPLSPIVIVPNAIISMYTQVNELMPSKGMYLFKPEYTSNHSYLFYLFIRHLNL